MSKLAHELQFKTADDLIDYVNEAGAFRSHRHIACTPKNDYHNIDLNTTSLPLVILRRHCLIKQDPELSLDL